MRRIVDSVPSGLASAEAWELASWGCPVGAILAGSRALRTDVPWEAEGEGSGSALVLTEDPAGTLADSTICWPAPLTPDPGRLEAVRPAAIAELGSILDRVEYVVVGGHLYGIGVESRTSWGSLMDRLHEADLGVGAALSWPKAFVRYDGSPESLASPTAARLLRSQIHDAAEALQAAQYAAIVAAQSAATPAELVAIVTDARVAILGGA